MGCRRTGAGFLAVVAVLVVTAALGSPASARAPKVYVSQCGNSVYRPHHIVVFCGDAGVIVDDISWNHWGYRSADGGGTAFTKTCDPDCATGGFDRDRVSVHLSRRHRCGSSGRRYFLRITVRYPAGNVLRHSLGCPY
jgi:hypothetical protein